MIDGIPFGDFGLGAIVTLAILMIFTGKLVPKRFLDASEKREAKQATINETNAAALTQMSKTLDLVVELAKTSDHMLREIQSARHRRTAHGEGATTS